MRIASNIYLAGTLLLFACSVNEPIVVDTIAEPGIILEHVDPFIGTGGHGHTFPGATTPFGMVQCSPQTRTTGWDGCSGYHFSDTTLYGFAHTALSGTGVSDYGDIMLLPVLVGQALLRDDQGQVFSTFKKQAEAATAGLYEVTLDSGIKVRLSATPRVGVHEYRYPEGTDAALIIDLAHRDEILDTGMHWVDDSTLVGRRISRSWAQEQHIYFAARFSSPHTQQIETKDPKINRIQFTMLPQQKLTVKVALSAVSTEGALHNLEVETSGRSFEELLTVARQSWLTELSRIKIRGQSSQQATIFYTALYHSFIAPNLYNDVDGQYRGMDLKLHQLTADRQQYTVFSLWDTYRAAHPLYTLIQPRKDQAFIQTLLDHAALGGVLPIWELAANYTGCMIGYHSISVIWDAYQKGLRGFDAETAFTAMKQAAMLDHRGLQYTKSLEFIPADLESESVSKTLEYAYDDWCIAQMAGALGKLDDQRYFSQRAQYWKNVLDPATGFMRGRSNGSWFTPFDPREVNFNYTEANAWQYRFYVPQDLETLIQRLGGPRAFEAQLDSLFETSSRTTGRQQSDITGMIGQYAHGNEPSHHVAYLYNYVGKPWKTQKRVRQIMDELYTAAPDGLSGNEDCGQMSAWLVLSALGFYPVCPGDGLYVLGSPWFTTAQVQLSDSTTLTLEAHDNARDKPYIQSIARDGQPYTRTYLRHADLLKGGRIDFFMASRPEPDLGADPASWPASRIQEPYLQAPSLASDPSAFNDSTELRLLAFQPDQIIRYSLTYDRPPGSTLPILTYTGPLQVKQSGTINFWSEQGLAVSPCISSTFHLIPQGKTIRYYHQGVLLEGDRPYANQYSAGGDLALIDGIRGRGDFRTGTWQGYQGQDLEVVVDLGQRQPTRFIKINFLQDENAWIFMPDSVIIRISEDGEAYRTLLSRAPETAKRSPGTQVEAFQVKFSVTPTRYVQVVGRNIENCPDWHKSRGGDCWLFADEIDIR